MTNQTYSNSTKSSLMVLFGFSIVLVSCFPKIYEIPVSERVDISVYGLASDYAEKNPLECYTVIESKKNDFLRVGDVFKKENDELLSRGSDLWMIEYNDEKYLNLITNDIYMNCFRYTKVEIARRIVVVVIDEDTSRDCKTVSHDLPTVLAHEIAMSGRHWMNKEGKKVRILFVNTEPVTPPFRHTSGYVPTKLLTKKNINNLLKTTLSKEEINKLSYEDILMIIQEYNDKYPL